MTYIKRLFLFSIPLLVITSPFIFQYFLFNISGENTFQFVSKKKQNTIVGYKYDNYKDIYYKYQILSQEKFDIIGIGSSRVLQFRETFFNKKFYAWNIINYSADYMSVFKALKEKGKLPSVFLLQLDERTFNRDFDKPTTTLAKLKYPNIIEPDVFLTKNIILDYTTLSRQKTFGDYTLWGLGAQYHFSGYRYDGSYLYGKLVYDINYNRKEFDSTFVVQQGNIDSTSTFFNINYTSSALKNLEKFLQACTLAKIDVICFFQPYPNSILIPLKQKGFYSNILDVHQKVEKLIRGSQHLYLDSEALPTDDELNLDGIHPTEKSNVNLLQLIPKGTRYRKLLNEKFLSDSTKFASNACLDGNELAKIKKFFELTKNHIFRK